MIHIDKLFERTEAPETISERFMSYFQNKKVHFDASPIFIDPSTKETRELIDISRETKYSVKYVVYFDKTIAAGALPFHEDIELSVKEELELSEDEVGIHGVAELGIHDPERVEHRFSSLRYRFSSRSVREELEDWLENTRFFEIIQREYKRLI